jgi:hypothetical protein
MFWGAQPSVWVGRGALVLGLLVSLLAGAPSGYGPPVFLVVVVGLAALLAALYPEGLALPLAMVVVVAWWTFQLHGEMPAAVLVVAAGLTVAHVAAVVLAYGPASLVVDPALALLWCSRAALAWLAALLVWGVARVYAGHATPSLFWLSGLAAAVVGSVVAGWAISSRSEGLGDPSLGPEGPS